MTAPCSPHPFHSTPWLCVGMTASAFVVPPAVVRGVQNKPYSPAYGMYMVAAGAKTGELTHPLIANDVTELIGRVRCSLVIFYCVCIWSLSFFTIIILIVFEKEEMGWTPAAIAKRA